MKRVTIQALCIYVYALVLGILSAVNTTLPYEGRLVSGLACIPAEYSSASTLFFYLAFLPLFALIPVLYAIYVSCDIYVRSLLPPSGERRVLVIYFARIILAFLLMWLPSLIFIFFIPWVNHWAAWVGGAWSHLQGLVSAGVSLMKPDIWAAFQAFVCCKTVVTDEQESTSYSVSGRRRRSRRQSSNEATEDERKHALGEVLAGTDGDGTVNERDPEWNAEERQAETSADDMMGRINCDGYHNVEMAIPREIGGSHDQAE
jgi:hypothetical protein